MLLFETPEKEETSEPRPELQVVASYLDDEHAQMLEHLCSKGKTSKSDAVRQCIRLGYRNLLERELANSKKG